jgi:hypothetical protein
MQALIGFHFAHSLKNKNYMKLFKKQSNNDEFLKCNETEDLAFQEVKANINKITNNSALPSEDYKSSLKNKILAGRAGKKSMEDKIYHMGPRKPKFSFLSPKKLAPIVASILIVAIVVSGFYFWPSDGTKSPFSGFSKLLINPAHAQDFFELVPSSSDSLGVDGDSSYTLKSKGPVDTGLIKDYLKLVPEVDFKLKEVSDSEWQIFLDEPLDANQIFQLKLAASYVDEDGNQRERDFAWAYQIKDRFKVLHSIPRDFGTGVPVNTGIEITFSHDNYANFGDYFSIEPKVEGKFEQHGRTMVFVPFEPLKSDSLYTVKLNAGLPLNGSSETLMGDYSFTFETQQAKQYYNSNQWFYVYRKILEAPTGEAPLISVQAKGVPDNMVSVDIFEFDNWQDYYDAIKKRDNLPWWSYSKDKYVPESSSMKNIDSFSSQIKTENKSMYLEMPYSFDKGYYLVKLKALDIEEYVWMQITNVSAYASITKNKTIIWANDVGSKEPISQANVEIMDSNFSYKTDGVGVAAFDNPAILTDDAGDKSINKRYYIKIERGDDRLIMAASPISRYYRWQGYNDNSDYWKYLYTDRPRYQTDDTIKYWGMLKLREDTKIKEQVTVSLFKEGYVDYYYRPVKITEQTVEIDGNGMYSGEIDFKDLRPDHYTLELKVGDTMISRKYVNIRPYTKPAYNVSLTADTRAQFAGENINLEVEVTFFEGTPVPELPMVFQMPEGDYNFVTDEFGKAKLTYTKKYKECSRKYGCWPEYAYLKVRPENSELAEISASVSTRFYGPNVDLRYSVSYPEEGKARIDFTTKKIDIKLMEDNPWYKSTEFSPAPNTKIEADVIKVTHIKTEIGTGYDFINKRTYKKYRYSTREEKIETITMTTDGEGKYSYERDVDPQTSYRLEMKVYDSQGKYERYMGSLYYHNGRYIRNYSSWNYSYFHLNLGEKNTYKLGEEVVAKFMHNEEPMEDGKNRFLFLQLQNGLQEFRVQDSHEYRFYFSENDIPNINLVGVYFNGRSYITSSTGWYGSRSARFDTSERELDIKVTTDKEKYKPGETVKMSVAVTDKDGKGKKSSVNLNLIDEAYYAIISDYVSPMSTIYSNIGTGELYNFKTHFDVPNAMDMAEKGGCFTAGTEITMADGSIKPIEEIEIGDYVSSFSDPLSKEIITAEVTKTFEHMVKEYVIINNELSVTPDHLVYAGNEFRVAGSLKRGDYMMDEEGERVLVESVEVKREMIEVFNFTVEPTHTYFAGGYYVHNEKGGGPREYFTDAALFKAIETDGSGRANVEFKLPDNITSWRVTSQAISKDLYVGLGIEKIPVSLPVFTEVTIGDEYLIDDKPVARMRAFGTALRSGDDISYSLSAESLGLKKSETQNGKAFKPTFFELPELEYGRHDVTYNLESSKGDDAVKLPINVISSRLEYVVAENERLTTKMKLKPKNDLPLTVVFMDEGQNQLYRPLVGLAWSWGDRVDQRVSQKISRDLLSKYYNETDRQVDFKAHNYQLSSGGVTLLPYSDAELELSARIAGLPETGFDEESLSQYFFGIVENKNSNREEVSLALFGLAELGKPVLTRMNVWLTRGDLSVKERLYLAQGMYDLGAHELARVMYLNIMEEYAQTKEPHVAIRVGDTMDDVFHATMIGAVLSASLNMPEAEGMFDFVSSEQHLSGDDKNSENLFKLEKLNYIAHALPNLKPSPAKIEYEFFGKKKVEITGGVSRAIRVASAHADKFKILSIEGDVGVSVRHIAPFDPVSAKRDNEIAIRREYYVDGVKTNTFKENDTIEVRLYPSFSSRALNDYYQITDYLPSGLMPITKYYQSGYNYDCHVWYPYNSDGQSIKYKVHRDWKNYYCGGGYIKYFARVKNKGEYKAEPAIVQSFLNPDFVNYSDESKVIIE